MTSACHPIERSMLKVDVSPSKSKQEMLILNKSLNSCFAITHHAFHKVVIKLYLMFMKNWVMAQSIHFFNT